MYGDTMLNVDLGRMLAAHPVHASATLFLHPNDHPQDSDLVELDDAKHVTALHPYPHPEEYRLSNRLSNLVNAALYVFSKRALNRFSYINSNGPLPISASIYFRQCWPEAACYMDIAAANILRMQACQTFGKGTA